MNGRVGGAHRDKDGLELPQSIMLGVPMPM
jgi:hypothetical protein